jgi:outer membrane scaffolding protein for murein synthesis (MipA/OmpV family)
MKRLISVTALLGAALLASPASGQVAETQPGPTGEAVGTGDMVSIGIGAAAVPDYEGSDDHRFVPAIVFRAQTGGITIFSRGTYLYADLVPGGKNFEFDAGPIVGVRLNRTGNVKDDRVDELPERNIAVEAGAFGGVTFHGLTNPYDSLSLRVDAVKDLANAHESWVISPALDFGTPVSRTTFVGASFSMDFVTDKFASYYYDITPSASLDSGLPTFNADGGLKSWQVGLFVGQSLSGDLRKGWGLFGSAGYKKLVGDMADSPIVDDRGSSSQWFGALGVGYTF